MKDELWTEFTVDNLCGLCGNWGVNDTRGKKTPAGYECGAIFYCICPNGRALKRRDKSSTSDSKVIPGVTARRVPMTNDTPAPDLIPDAGETPTADEARIAEIAARAEAATPGPWYAHHTDDEYSMNVYSVSLNKWEPDTDAGNGGGIIAATLLQSEIKVGHDDGKWENNADFMAHARADVPWLLGKIRSMALDALAAEGRSQKEIERLQAEVAELRETMGFYADESSYCDGLPATGEFDGIVPIEWDNGTRARAALAQKGTQ